MLIAVIKKDQVIVRNENGGFVKIMSKRGVVSANINGEGSLMAVAIANKGVEVFRIPEWKYFCIISARDVIDARWSGNDTVAISRANGTTELRNVRTSHLVRIIR